MPEMELNSALAAELGSYREARRAGDVDQQWRALERAHVLSQPMLLRHLQVHRQMLGLAIRSADGAEVVGQIARLALAPLGHLTGRVPVGNTGRSNVSAFQPMRVPEDLRHLVHGASSEISDE